MDPRWMPILKLLREKGSEMPLSELKEAFPVPDIEAMLLSLVSVGFITLANGMCGISENGSMALVDEEKKEQPGARQNGPGPHEGIPNIPSMTGFRSPLAGLEEFKELDVAGYVVLQSGQRIDFSLSIQPERTEQESSSPKKGRL